MDQAEFPAIQYPTTWPPPEQPACPAHPASRIPLIGALFQYCRWLRCSRQHLRAVLDPIADEIISQLDARPTEGDWPAAPEQRALAQMISEAVSLEKGLTNPPALHPDDPFPLLFWGPFDDLTPMIVCHDSREKLNREILKSVVMDAWNQRWTIRRFVEHCTQPKCE